MRVALAAGVALVALTLLVYAPVGGFESVNYDDDVYVFQNPHVVGGLDATSFAWSWTAFENGNYHPLTLLSHLLDVSLFGLDAGWHHRVNLLLHVVNVLLLYSLLAWTTSRPWLSACAAALFAVHPLGVETVAWIAERKSLLSTAFWLAALLVQVRYRKHGGLGAYLGVVLLAALALASKPMAVTLPLTLVLLDRWPLETAPSGRGSLLSRYARELAPTLVLALACGIVTIVAQRAVHALQSVASYPLGVRLANAVVAYAWYLRKAVWPSGLAVFYPHPGSTISVGEVARSALVIVAAVALVVWIGAREKPLHVGFSWYAMTLLPVAGVLQVGSQAYADRYAYVPLIGIFFALVWSLAKVVGSRSPKLRVALAAAAVLTIAALAVRTRAQTLVWRDSVSLFQNALTVVPDSAVAHNNLGMAFAERKRMSEALEQFRSAINFAPWDTDARSNIGNALRALGRPAEAVEEYRKALEQRPEDPTIHYNLATALWDLGRADETLAHLEEAVRLDPGYSEPRALLGPLLYRSGRPAEALAQFQEILKLDPRDARSARWIERIERELGRR